MWLLLAFVALPLIEIALFVLVGGWIGLGPTLALVVLGAVAGIMVMRAEGMRAMTDLRRSLDELRDPAEPLAHGALILLGGALLLLPGFLTDAVGVVLLVPPLRRLLLARMGRRVRMAGFATGTVRTRPDVIDGEFHEVPHKTLHRPDDSDGPARPGGSGWTRH